MILDSLILLPSAFLAGILMFLAPCTLPIVPGYLAFISGSTALGNDLNKKGRMVRNAIAFVIGFAIIFILLGVFAGSIGGVLAQYKDFLSRLAGAVIILFGITMLGIVRIPFLSGDSHIRIPKFLKLGSPHSSALIGALFALGWSPCIGPILGTVLFVASSSATALSGALLLAAFSFGLGLPFILSAIFMEQAETLFSRMGTLTVGLSRIGGVILILLGVLMLLGDMGLLVTWGFGFFDFAGYKSLLNHL
jgi:cytochrome c-type biogenesis protein